MMRTDRRGARWALLLTCLVLAALFPAIGSAGGAAGSTDPRVVGHEVGRSHGEIVRYWTRARMRAALPAERLIRDRRPSPKPMAAPIAGTPMTVEPSFTISSEPERWPGGARYSTTSSDLPFTISEVPNVTDLPYRMAGKVFFTLSGNNYVCSASSVTSPSESLVWTAGHCVNGGGDGGSAGPWATNWAFVPGYRDGNRPYGTWTATHLYALAEWAQWTNFKQDLGAAIMPPMEGSSLADVVGGYGMRFNQSYTQVYKLLGWPQASPFNGSKLYACDSSVTSQDDWNQPGPPTIAAGCSMTGGSSGGPWIVDLQYVQSVNSYGYTGLPDVMFGPYHGTEAKSLYDAVNDLHPGVSPSPSPSPSASASPSPSPSPSSPPGPGPDPSPSPSPSPSSSPDPSPSASPSPSPTASPTPEPDETPPTLTGVTARPTPFTPTKKKRKKTRLYFEIDEQATVAIIVRNKKGKTVRNFGSAPTEPGHYFVVWNGRNNNGKLRKKGIYRFRIDATDAAGNSRRATAKVRLKR